MSTTLSLNPRLQQAAEQQRLLAVSRQEAAHALGCSIQHIDDLVNVGKLKKIVIGQRRVAITWPSLVKFVEEASSDE